MSSQLEPWVKTTHVIPASHPRGYIRGVRDPQTSRLKLHVSQYVPHEVPTKADIPAVTLILQHGMAPGDNAACLEPFLSDLLGMLRVPVRGIWAMDAVGCGKSFSVNKDEIGDEHHWFDSARDILQMVNHFQNDMPPPIIGFGQSWGVSALLISASWSPRLFHGIICSEPTLESGYHIWKSRGSIPGEDAKINLGARLYKRQRVWDSQQAVNNWWTQGAGRHLGGQYESRVLGKILANDYYERPDGKVELVTPPSQTVAFFVRPDPPVTGIIEDPIYFKRTEEMRFPQGFWSPSMVEVRKAVENVRCRVLFLWATESFLPRSRQEFVMNNIGCGISGGGGMEDGQVEEAIVEGGHSLPLFVPERTAKAIVPWIEKMWQVWNEQHKARMQEPPIYADRLPKEFEERLLGTNSKL